MIPLTALAAVAMLAFSPMAQPVEASENDRSETYKQLKLFGDVFERVRADYVEEVSDEELIEAAIEGMLTSLDPHSSYLSADHFADMRTQTRGEFGGLGIEVTMEDGLVKVVSPIDDTPAERAGIQAGDLIIGLDDEPVMGMSLSDAVEQMRGEVDSDITLTIQRGNDEPFEVTVTRETITIRAVRSEVFDNVGYIRISTFNEQTGPNLADEVRKVREELGDDAEGYVLDLRNNPGGLLEQAIGVTDAFLDQGEIVSTRSRDENAGQRFNAKAGELLDGAPLVVLINSGSASASEIVAGALQDHQRAIVMGTSTFGKGSVQTVVPLPGQGAMRLTTARYYTPSGRSIQAQGIEPDINVLQANIEIPEEVNRRRESDLRGALLNDNDVPEQEVEKGLEEELEEEDPKAARLRDDYQLARAVDLIRGLKFFEARLAN